MCIWTVSFSLGNQILPFGSKNLSGLGELVILKNVDQTSFLVQVALKTSLEAAQCTRFVLGAMLFTNGDKKI